MAELSRPIEFIVSLGALLVISQTKGSEGVVKVLRNLGVSLRCVSWGRVKNG